MGGGARFWRNVALIAGAHVALLVAFVRWGSSAKPAPQQQIVWLSGGSVTTAAATNANASSASTPLPEPSETPDEQPTVAPAKSEIQLPVATPTPTPTPAPLTKRSPIPPMPKPSPKPTPRPTPKKSLIAKATPRPRPKATPEPEESEPDIEAARDAIAKISGAASGGGGNAHGASAKSDTQWYGRMLHDRFHNAWDQPTSVVAAGTKMSALVKARIEKNGRVTRFEIVKPSGNVVVDDSVRAVAGKVTQVDPLPNGIGNGEHYDVTINFELNPEE